MSHWKVLFLMQDGSHMEQEVHVNDVLQGVTKKEVALRVAYNTVSQILTGEPAVRCAPLRIEEMGDLERPGL